jgi:hypothetical protein
MSSTRTSTADSGGVSTTIYTSASIAGWTAQNGNGAASIDGGFKIALLTAQSSSAAYPDTTSPKYYRNIAADISGSEDFTIWARIVSASMVSDQNIGIALGDSSDTTNVGICAFTGVAGQLTCTPFASTGYIGAPAGVVALDGTGWLGIARRGGLYSALGGTGTAKIPPTQYASCMTTTVSSNGYSAPARFTIWAQKFGGTDMSGVFDDITIIKRG